VVRAICRNRFLAWGELACATRRYWLSVFPRVAYEVRSRRVLATRIPDPALRSFALEAIDRKRGNLEGAAAFASLVPRTARPSVVKALVACQAICDYLDLLSEQPTHDPVANGYRLHEALIVATTPGEPHRDYYAYNAHGEDGGYLRALVDAARAALSTLPSIASIGEPMRRATERVAVYQSFNHGDANGSYEPFERWAAQSVNGHTELRSWEMAAAAGSTLTVFALIAGAAERRLCPSAASEIENAYFPWIGALHSLLDSLVDHEEDIALEGRALVDYYSSPIHAAARMGMIAGEAVRRAEKLPDGRGHALIVAAMASFYMCELRDSTSIHARVVAPNVLEAIGGLATPTMVILGARRSLRSLAGAEAGHLTVPVVQRMALLESQVPEFPLVGGGQWRDHALAHQPNAHSVSCPPGGKPARPQT
jgi:tetraprenyl-beta-curcumene synthase